MSETKQQFSPVAIEPKVGEPWVALANGRELADWGRDEEIAYNQNNRQTEKALFYRRTFDFLTDNRVAGDYHEFGCHRCRTFRMALTEARRHDLDRHEFFAFDSFEGLPDPTSDTSVEIWKRGALTTSEDAFRGHGARARRLPRQRQDHQRLLRRQPDAGRGSAATSRKAARSPSSTSIATSTSRRCPVFNFIDPLLQEGSAIYIDDLFAGYKGSPAKGVARAFLEWQERTRWKLVRHLDIGWWGRSYLVYLEKEAAKGVL